MREFNTLNHRREFAFTFTGLARIRITAVHGPPSGAAIRDTRNITVTPSSGRSPCRCEIGGVR